MALRNWQRQKIYSLINILGLCVALTCCMLIFLYVWNEWRHDQHHTRAEQIYRLVLDARSASGTGHAAVSAFPFAPRMQDEFPEVLKYVRFIKTSGLFQYKTRRFQEDDVLFSDGSLFDVFTQPLKHGDFQTALTRPFAALVTQETAQKYFDRTDVIGESLIMDNQNSYTITGVFDDLPPSHLHFEIILSMPSWESLNFSKTNNWTWFNFYTYLLLPQNYSPAALEAKLSDFYRRHAGDLFYEEGIVYTFPLQKMTDIYLLSNRQAEIGRTGSLSTLYVLSAIAGFILLLACVNFINLATARSVRRAREVGIRKVIGAQPRQLVIQFLSESLLLVFLAGLLALLVTWEFLPMFNNLTGKSLSLKMLTQPSFLMFFLALLATVGLIAGVYPAFVLSGFRPIAVLKGKFAATGQGKALRRGLVVFQFAISISLIIGLFMLYYQLDYLQSRSLGFDKEQILILTMGSESVVRSRFETIKNSFLNHPAVIGATASDFSPGSNVGMITANVENHPGESNKHLTPYCLVDYDFFKTYGIEIIAGRSFSRNFVTDASEAFIINRAAVVEMGWSFPEEALGKKVEQWGREGSIIGVAENFHFKSLHFPVEPLFMHIRPDWFKFISLRINTDNIRATLSELEDIWNSSIPETPFDFAFADDRIERQYNSETRLGQLLGYLSGLALFIACLGLFGLASFSAGQRTKEIGIRKTLGASAARIVVLLSQEFTMLVLFANIIAWPLAYYFMNRWLQGFAFRIELNLHLWTFAAAGLAALLIAVMTVSYQALKAALANPVDSLRYE